MKKLKLPFQPIYKTFKLAPKLAHKNSAYILIRRRTHQHSKTKIGKIKFVEEFHGFTSTSTQKIAKQELCLHSINQQNPQTIHNTRISSILWTHRWISEEHQRILGFCQVQWIIWSNWLSELFDTTHYARLLLQSKLHWRKWLSIFHNRFFFFTFRPMNFQISTTR